MDTVTLITARRNGVDGFSAEMRRLQKDPVFHGFLKALVTCESLIFNTFFLTVRRYANHMVTDQGCKEDVTGPSRARRY